jgi:hypothetical protein
MAARIFIVTGLCAMSCSHRPPAAASPELACRDFYQYANRAWLASAKIPADEDRWGVREDMRRRTRDQLHAILESLRAAPQPPGSLEAKLGGCPRPGDLPAFAAAFGCGPGSPMVRPAELRPQLF